MDTRSKMIMLFNEGKVWDKVKQVWRDHSGKILAGAIVGSIGAKYALKNASKKPLTPSDTKDTYKQDLKTMQDAHKKNLKKM